MSDASIPLTTGEWTEWGQVNSEPFYSYMRSYCPYSGVTAQDYPNILVLAGLHDPRVAYWEPAKWVAKLRDLKTDNNVILLKTDLESGHFSASDRYSYFKAKSEEYAYVCDQIGATKLIK
jgi:oligopeptidase B